MEIVSVEEKAKKFFHKKNLVYIIITLIFLTLFLITFFQFIYPENTIQPKAAIIDQLGSSLLDEAIRYSNQTFINTTKQLLSKKFSTIDYYSDNATVEEYKNLASKGYKFIIWRAHSALDKQKFISISTSEEYKAKKYSTYMENGQLSICNVSGHFYFGITPKFLNEIMSGNFEDTVIILMSCNGLKQGYHKTAKAFKEKGVKALISWDSWIDPRDNDNSIELLLKYLIIKNWTIGKAVDEIPTKSSEFGPVKLRYYPTTLEVKNYVIPNYKETNLTSKIWLNTIVISKKRGRLANLIDTISILTVIRRRCLGTPSYN
jgi:hypothetical protein